MFKVGSAFFSFIKEQRGVIMANQDLNPTGDVQGSSYLYQYGTTPNTRIVMSQKIRLLTPAYGGGDQLYQIGLVSDFAGVSQSKSAEIARGIGFGDHIAEIVPGVTDVITISITRALMYLSNIWQATGYAGGVDGAVRSLKHHRWPFDLEFQLVFSTLADADLSDFSTANTPSGTGASNQDAFHGGHKSLTYPQVSGGITDTSHSVLITMYEACWWTSWDQQNMTAEGAMVTESGDAQVTDVHDYSSTYGEFINSGNDPSQEGQRGSIRFGATKGAASPNLV
tara:strand:+ start:348 stop:1193 length:846 start_codon:yes stop_codon:yes gene_type:complete